MKITMPTQARMFSAALLGFVVFIGTGAASYAQARVTDKGSFTVVPFGGSNRFLDPSRYGIYCASSHLLELADPVRGYPPWRALTEFRSTMEAWREASTLPAGRTAADFVIYLKAGTTFHVLFAPSTNDRQNPHYKITVDSGPYAGRTCWTNYH